MRWKNKQNGDIRIKEKFILFPITLDGETRWLEWVKLEEKYSFCPYTMNEWVPIRFING